MRHAAFTLVELLVVIAIIAILAGIATPVYQHVIQSGRATACVSNLRQLGTALNLYLAEHNQTMPVLAAGRASTGEDVQVIDNTLNAYAPNPKIFACPADTLGLAAKSGTSYYWNNALNGQMLGNLNFMNLITDMSRIPILSDKQGFHPYAQNKVNMLYADGHASKELSFFTGN
jgi:prepilin-type N-terminal cleavage/methylation domain-containing protein/prepilin-type processing-associated H-X9-DG protein